MRGSTCHVSQNNEQEPDVGVIDASNQLAVDTSLSVLERSNSSSGTNPPRDLIAVYLNQKDRETE